MVRAVTHSLEELAVFRFSVETVNEWTGFFGLSFVLQFPQYFSIGRGGGVSTEVSLHRRLSAAINYMSPSRVWLVWASPCFPRTLRSNILASAAYWHLMFALDLLFQAGRNWWYRPTLVTGVCHSYVCHLIEKQAGKLLTFAPLLLVREMISVFSSVPAYISLSRIKGRGYYVESFNVSNILVASCPCN